MTAATSADPATDGVLTRWLVPLIVLIVGMFMSLLDISIVNVAIPTMQRDFGVATDDIQWVTTAYTLALGVIVPLSGWLGDRLGLVKVYLWSLLLFSVASLLCGLAWDLTSMVVFRILQAAPGGILPVVTLSMVYKIVPKHSIGSAMGIYGVGVAFAPAIGPTLGGYLVEYIDWRLVFFINGPIGVLGAVVAYFLLPAMPPIAARAFDWWGFASIASGLFALLLAFEKGEDWGWDSQPVLILIVGGLLALAVFVVIELESNHPLIELDVFRNWPYVNSLLLISVLTVGLFAILFYLPLYMQTSLGIQPLRTGLILLPEALVMGVLMPIAGKLYDKIGPRWPAVIGLSIAAYGTYLLCGISPDMSEGQVVLWTCVRAAGNGLALMPIMTAGLAAIPPRYTSSGSAVNNIAQRIPASLGLAALTILATNNQHQLMADRSGLLPASAGLPELAEFTRNGPVDLYPLYLRLQADVLASAYSDVFLVTALLTLIGAVLAAMLRRQPITDQPARPVRSAEVGAPAVRNRQETGS